MRRLVTEAESEDDDEVVSGRQRAPLVRRQRIARTIVSERVRATISEIRQARRIIVSSEEESEEEEEEEEEEESPDEARRLHRGGINDVSQVANSV